MPTDTAVYFDLDGTLVHLDCPFEDVVSAAFERCDYAADGATVDAYVAALGDCLADCAHDPYARAVETADLDVDPELFDAAIHVVEPGFTEADPDAVAVLSGFDRECERERVRVGVLTNGEGRMQRAKLDACGLTTHVDEVVVSGEVGVGKSDSGVYAAAEERLPAAAHAFVANDLSRDVVPAVERGWTGVYVGDAREAGETADVPTAASLGDVPALLDESGFV